VIPPGGECGWGKAIYRAVPMNLRTAFDKTGENIKLQKVDRWTRKIG